MSAAGFRRALRLRQIRERTARQMTRAWLAYTDGLAERVSQRLGAAESKAAVPTAEELLDADDGSGLWELVKRFYVLVLQQSWTTWNTELGIEVAFDLVDQVVVQVLELAGTRVKDIQATTLESLRTVLRIGAEEGWSIEHLVRGDPAVGIPGIRDVVGGLVYEDKAGRRHTLTPQQRGTMVARTELGTAQNTAASGRYAAAGVTQVDVFDDGHGDEDEPCVRANGAVWTLAEMQANPLEHPNCTRAFAAHFGGV